MRFAFYTAAAMAAIIGQTEAMKLTLQPEAELKAHLTTEAEAFSRLVSQMAAISVPKAPGATTAGGPASAEA